MVVVTSRDSLAGLVARDGAHRLDLDLLPAADAVALLRALIGGRADADPAAAQTLADLCARLPLALRIAAELAAARPDTPLAELASRAGRRSRTGWTCWTPAATRAARWPACSPGPTATCRPRPPGCSGCLACIPGQDWDRYAAAALTGAAAWPRPASCSACWPGRT